MTELLDPLDSVTVLPPSRLLLESLTVTVIVELAKPSAVNVVGDAVTVDCDALAGAAPAT